MLEVYEGEEENKTNTFDDYKFVHVSIIKKIQDFKYVCNLSKVFHTIQGIVILQITQSVLLHIPSYIELYLLDYKYVL